MASPHSEGDNAPTRYLIAKSQTSSDRNGLHLVEMLAKGIPWTPPSPNITGCCPAICCSPQPEDKALCRLVLCVNLTQASHQRGRSLHWENASMRFSCKTFSQLVTMEESPAYRGWCDP